MTKAAKITAQGTYSKTQQVFQADNLLVKCPSKYQGTTERSYGKA
jgi:cytochrome c-type biogenesis protein CcmE